jgi:enamine deaminase RidA (YjgF/YER057c/UK114 family)
MLQRIKREVELVTDMKKKVFWEHGREFIELSCEGRPEASVEEETRELFQRVDKVLSELNLSIENIVRTRTWASDKNVRDLATDERSKILTGRTRTSSSSYICPEHFDSNARVALDVIAMRPANPNPQRLPVEYDSPKKYLRYLIYDSFAFLSGVVAAGPRFDNQLAAIFAEIDGSLRDCATSWDKVTSAAYFLHRSQNLELLKGLLGKQGRLGIPKVEFCSVDDFAPAATWIEVEVTAKINKQA